MPDLPDLPVETLEVRPLPDAVIDQLGHDPRSDYVERFWLAVLGPSAVWLLRRLVAGLDDAPDGYALHLPTIATELGLGARGGRNGPFMRTLERCERFGMVQRIDATSLLVRRRLPPLTRLQLLRLPEALQREHERWGRGGPTDALEHARGLALSLLRRGDDPLVVEAALHARSVHPAVAHAAVGWASGRSVGVRQRIAADDLPPEAA